MKIKLLAIAAIDGWAYLKIKDQILLIKPPYTPSFTEKAIQEDIEKAISLFGFEKIDIDFDNLEDVILYIKNEFVRCRKANDFKMPSKNEIKEVLQYAPKDIIEKFLNKIETQILPAHKINFALQILNDIFDLPITINDKELMSKAEKVFQKCINKQVGIYKTPVKKSNFQNVLNEYSIGPLIKFTYKKSKLKTLFNFA